MATRYVRIEEAIKKYGATQYQIKEFLKEEDLHFNIYVTHGSGRGYFIYSSSIFRKLPKWMRDNKPEEQKTETPEETKTPKIVERGMHKRIYRHSTGFIIRNSQNYEDLEDRDLIKLSAEDNRAFDEFVKRYSKLFLYKIRGLPSRMDEDDVYNDFLLHLYRCISEGRITINGDPISYIIAMAKNFKIDKIREHNREVKVVEFSTIRGTGVDGQPIDIEFAANEKEPWENLIEDADRSKVIFHEALGILSDHDKKILEFKSLGVSGKEIAEIIGVSHATVRQRIRRAKIRIIDYIIERYPKHL